MSADMKVLQQLAAALDSVTKASGSPTDATPMYGDGGLFGSCAQDPALINAMVNPMGYGKLLSYVGTIYDSPVVQYISRIHSSGYAQTDGCSDCGTPTIHRCSLSACFGRICQGTEEFQFDTIGTKDNPQVNTLALYGNITDPDGKIIIGQGQRISNMFTLQVMSAAYNLRRRLGQLLWSGNPANNAGGYMEFPGFDLWINTGKMDTITGLECDALDPVLFDFENNPVGAAGSPSILQYIAGALRTIKYRIDGSGFDSSGSVIDIVMHPTLWDCVADAVACEYGLQCNSWTQASTTVMTNDALAVADIRDQFRAQMQLRIDGQTYNVVLDNGIAVTLRQVGNETRHCSTIYIITRVIPGAPMVTDSPGNGIVTWGEYQDMQASGGEANALFRQLTGNNVLMVTDGGRFATGGDVHGKFCFDVATLTKPRIRMSMPWTSSRITNVCCVPTGHYADVTGSGGTYEVGGGATTTPEAYLYGDCWPTHVGDPVQ